MERDTMFAQENAWQTERLGKFTASEIHRLLKSGRKKEQLFGDGAMTFINEVIAEMITGEAAEQRDFKATEWGQANELDAILDFQQRTSIQVDYYGISNPKFFPYGDISGGSPDGLISELKAIVEVKCPYNSSNHVSYLIAAMSQPDIQAWFKDEHPDYYAQMQLNMMATGCNKGYFISYDPRTVEHKHRLVTFTINADEEMQADIEMRLAAALQIIQSNIQLLS